MKVLLPALGPVLILATLRDVFHTLFHPSGQGGATIGVFRAVWTVSGKLGDRAWSLSGPLSMALAITLWIGVLIVGWALVYWPSMPDSFIYSEALEAAAEDDFIDALYYAAVTQSTLGYGTIAPEQGIFRILAPLQAALGFGVFTLVVTWVLSVYPALHRQRAAAGLAHSLRISHERSVPARDTHPTTLARQMEQLSQVLNNVRVDFLQYPSTFYFAAPARTLSPAASLPFAVAIAEADGYADETHPAAAQLEASLELFAAALGEQHLKMPDGDVHEVLRAYRRHQGLGEEAQAPA